MTEIELFAKQYFKLGLNVTCTSNQLNEHNFYCRNISESCKMHCHPMLN